MSLSHPSHWVMTKRTSLVVGHTLHFGFIGETTLIEDLWRLKTLEQIQLLLHTTVVIAQTILSGVTDLHVD